MTANATHIAGQDPGSERKRAILGGSWQNVSRVHAPDGGTASLLGPWLGKVHAGMETQVITAENGTLGCHRAEKTHRQCVFKG